ncbi:hypothetical protein [Litorimonas sp. WD9-15]|uniref:hypothetical protein n=1 Tax=Litorimonas sp. WD9-15 TaxID=3418716 RepID=UPI003CFED3EE
MMKRILLASSLLSLGLLATGCASTAQGVKASVVTQSAPVETLRGEVPEGSVLTVIRYPAIVTEDARDDYHRAYARRAIGGATGRGVTNTIETVAIADSAVVKSNYFALSLYKELAARLPEHSVLLSPHAITLGPGGELTSEPMTEAEELPAVTSIDFSTYSFPDSKKMMGNVPLTFGDLVTPLVTVRTDHRAAAPTHGLLMASAPLVSRAAAEGQETALETINALQAGNLDPVIPELDFISYLTNDTPMRVETQGLDVRSETNSVMSLPVEKIKLQSSDMYLLDGASDGTVDPLDDVYTDAMARRIIALINGLDSDKAVMMGKAANVAEFDPSLAALTFVGSDEADYAARAAYADRLLEAQRKFLSVQSLRIFDGIHNGELGAQVRDMISAEYDVLEKRRKIARQQNAATMMAIAGVLGGAAIASGGENCRNKTTQREYDACVRRNRARSAASSAAIQGGIFAGTEAYSKAQLSQQVGNNYLNSIVPVLEQQTTVTIDLLDSNETITAIRYEDLQAKLQSLYTSKQRSLETVATQCAYLGTDRVKRGTWLGVCENGLANGTGAGVLEDADTVMEYYGYARNGLANGPGLMIRHSSIGSISYEGSFTDGQPDGTVRVSQSGRADKVRSFESGVDRGPSDQPIASAFDGATGGAIN